MRVTVLGGDAGIGYRYWLLTRISQVPEEGFQLSHTFVERVHRFSGNSREQFAPNIIGGGWVISKQRYHREQRLNFFADALDILLFLTQNATGSWSAPKACAAS
jgi:hypothetical protein